MSCRQLDQITGESVDSSVSGSPFSTGTMVASTAGLVMQNFAVQFTTWPPASAG